jgi:arylsulfatase
VQQAGLNTELGFSDLELTVVAQRRRSGVLGFLQKQRFIKAGWLGVNMNRSFKALSLGLLASATMVATGFAQQGANAPGSPGASAPISGRQLPPPDPKFGGVIKDGSLQSRPWWAPRVVPPKGAPNVLLIMTDDDGFGAPGTFGGVIPTPALDRIAKTGLRYTNFHSTSLCSPTRAAIITGRNHHSVGFGVVGEIATGFPGYDSIIPIEKGTIGTILKHNGYATSWFGKDHNTPFFQNSHAGPFNQ